jgi:hypothetical protein
LRIEHDQAPLGIGRSGDLLVVETELDGAADPGVRALQDGRNLVARPFEGRGVFENDDLGVVDEFEEPRGSWRPKCFSE